MISLHITSKNIHNTLYIVTYEDFYTYRHFIN